MLAVRAEREELEIRTRQRLSAAEAAIFRRSARIAGRSGADTGCADHIMQGHGAAWSWQRALRARIEKLQKVAIRLLAARAVDLRDVGEQVLAPIAGHRAAANDPVGTVDSGGGRPDTI
jgi:phosphoenolpyruvate-protein kinase (PTS system EI component)